MMNLQICGLYLNGIVALAERICFRNVVFKEMCREIIQSECKYFTMKACSNLQHMQNTKFINASNVNIIRCDVMKDTLKIFSGENL